MVVVLYHWLYLNHIGACVCAHDLPNINCFLAKNSRENHEMLDHPHSKGSQEFWDQWFWSLIFEDFSRVHPLSHRSQTQLLLKNIAIVARVLVSIPYPPFQHGHGSSWTLYNPSFHLKILMYSLPFLDIWETGWSDPFSRVQKSRVIRGHSDLWSTSFLRQWLLDIHSVVTWFKWKNTP